MKVKTSLRTIEVLLWLVLTVLAAFYMAACGSNGPTLTPSPVIAGPTFSMVDLPPTNPNPGYQCPTDAPTQFSVKVDEGGTKFTFDWRRTHAAVTSYILETRKRDRNTTLPPTYSTFEPKVETRYLTPGVYHFRLRANCPDGRWSAEVVVGGAFGPDVPPPPPVQPPVVPPPSPSPVCVTECS